MAARSVAFVALVASLFALGACPGSLSTVPNTDGGGTGMGGSGSGSPDGGSSSDAGVPLGCATSAMVLEINCTSCHSAAGVAFSASLDLMSDGVAQRLVGQSAAAMTVTNGAMCTGKGSLLNRGILPATGLLIDKINFHQTCGSGMPLGNLMPLGADDLACLQAWANGLVSSVGP